MGVCLNGQDDYVVPLLATLLKGQCYEVNILKRELRRILVVKVIPVDEDNLWGSLPEDAILPCDMYGPLLLRNGNPSLRKYLVKQHNQLNMILQELEKQPDSEAISNRKKEVIETLLLNESAYTILGAIKNAGI